MTRAWKVLAVVLAAFALAGVLFVKLGLKGDVDGARARKLVAAGARLIDVRSRDEFSDGHLPAALNIPIGELPQRVAELGAPDTTIIVYCHTGMRSSRAASLLRQRGFSNVLNLGAMGAW